MFGESTIMTYGISPSRFDSPLSLTHSLSTLSLSHLYTSLSLSLSLYLYLSLSHSLSLPLSISLSLSFSLSRIDSKKERAPSLYSKSEETGGPSRRSILG